MSRQVALLAAAALWACAGCSRAPEASTAPAAPVELSIGYADPRPPGTPDRNVRSIAANLSAERLVTLQRNGRPEPALAERWTLSADGLTWSFFLRGGQTLHDGSPIDAAVVKRSLERVIAGSRTNPRGLLWGMRDIVRIDAVGPTELRITLARPNRLLVEDLAIYPITGGGRGTAAAGPFQVVSMSPDEAVLAAFPGYHRGAPSIGRIRIREYPSPRSAWGAMLRGEIDFLYDVAPEAHEFVEQSSTTFVATFLRPFVTAVVFNQAHPVLRQRDVRLALNAGVNRTEVLRGVFQNRGFPATDHLWPKHWAVDTAAPRFRHDLRHARALLDRAGLKPVAQKGAAAGSRFAFTCLLLTDDPRFERVALFLQRQLIELGVDMKLEALPIPELQARIAAGEYDAFLLELIAGHGLDFTYHFWRSPGPSFLTTGYEAADAELDRIRDARSDEEVQTAVRALQEVMHRDPPGIFLLWGETSRAVSRRFEIPQEPDRDILSTAARWRVAGPGGR